MSDKAQTAKETPQQRALAERALNQLQDFKKRWLPVQRKLSEGIERSGASDSSERRSAAGQASTDNAVRFGEAQQGLEAAMGESGADLSSSKSKLATVGLGDDQATSRGLGFAASDQAVDDAYVAGLGQLTALGQGQKAEATGGMQQVADMSGRQAAADAEMAAARRAGNAQLGGQVAGLGLSAAMAPAIPQAMGVAGGGNDFAGVTPSNAMATWQQFGTSGS